MRLLNYIEIQNFKRFGERQRIVLDHPSVLVGPNNCGKTSAIQALALWSQAVRSWYEARRDSSATERTATSINRLAIVAVPVQRTRNFWHNARVQRSPLVITVGVDLAGQVVPLAMRFTHRGDELIYCTPDAAALAHPGLLQHAASIPVNLLYPMSGLETEEKILKPGAVDVLLGQGQTAQVLRNLCLMVHEQSVADWQRVQALMQRLFGVELTDPKETTRGSIDLRYAEAGIKGTLDVSSSGRGFQQLLLIFAYLYSHKGSVLLVDEPDAHLEILRQKQVYVLLRDIAHDNGAQVVMATHSEVILDEAIDTQVTLLLDGQADDLASAHDMRSSLKLFGAAHYLKARERGYVLYVEGSTDLAILRALAEHTGHPAAALWDERINSYYVQDNHPATDTESTLQRVEGGFGLSPIEHFRDLRKLLPSLAGLAILDGDARPRGSQPRGVPGLQTVHWQRYEIENYIVTPEVLRVCALAQHQGADLFDNFRPEIDATLDAVLLELVFDGSAADLDTWRRAPADAARLIWEGKTAQRKLSAVAEAFFRRLAQATGGPMLLRKADLHRLVPFVDAQLLPAEVAATLDLLAELFRHARAAEQAAAKPTA